MARIEIHGGHPLRVDGVYRGDNSRGKMDTPERLTIWLDWATLYQPDLPEEGVEN